MHYSLKADAYQAVQSLLVALKSTFSAQDAQLLTLGDESRLLLAAASRPEPPVSGEPVDDRQRVASEVLVGGQAVAVLEVVHPVRDVTSEQLAPFAETFAHLLSPGNMPDRADMPEVDERAGDQAAFRPIFDALSLQNIYLAKVIESLPGIVMVVGPPPEYELRYANAAAEPFLPEALRTAGAKLGDLIRRLSVRSDGGGAAPAEEVFHRVGESGRPLAYEMYETRDLAGRTTYWNWSIVPIQEPESGQSTAYLVIANDVTDLVRERSRAEKAAQEAKIRADELLATFDQMVDGVAIFNLAGERVRLNAAAQRFLNQSPGSEPVGELPLYGETYDFFTPEGIRYEAGQRPGVRAARGETVASEQLIVRWRDGEEAVLNVSASPVYDHDGKVSGSVSVFHDVTREKLLERMKDEFLSVVSHELRTPLSAVMGYSDLMLRGIHGPLSDRQARALTAIRANAGRLLHLINDVLDVSRLDANNVPIEIEPVNLHAVVTHTLAGYFHQARDANLQIENLVPRDLWAQGDPRRLQQVLDNLISNAIRFTAAGGSIRISCATSELKADDPLLQHEETRSLVSDPSRAQSILISVQDTGGGLTGEQLQQVWGRFYQADGSAKRKSGGAGLGLTIVRGLLELHGGQAWAESAGPQLGSTFSFSLPVVGSESQQALDLQAHSQAEREQLKTAGKRRKSKGLVLVAEDDIDQREIICEMLEVEGYDVALAADGEEAQQLVKKLHPSAVALDVLLPRMDGWEVLKEIKGNPDTQDIPVLIVSVIDHRAFGKKMGADEYLIKPVEPKALRLAIKRLVNKS